THNHVTIVRVGESTVSAGQRGILSDRLLKEVARRFIGCADEVLQVPNSALIGFPRRQILRSFPHHPSAFSLVKRGQNRGRHAVGDIVLQRESPFAAASISAGDGVWSAPSTPSGIAE